MFELLCFDICACAILVTLFFTIRGRNLMAGAVGRRLTALISVTIVAVALDMTVAVYNSNPRSMVAVGYTIMGLYNVARCLSFYVYCSYIVSLMGTWHRTGSSYINTVKLVPCFAAAAISASAPVVKAFYYYDSAGSYVRGDWYNVLYLCGGVYTLYAVYYIVKNVSLIGRRKTLALVSCSLFTFVSSYIQYNLPYLIVDILGFTVSLIVIVLFIDNPDDKLDDVTGVMNRMAYYEDIKLNYFTNKSFDIVQIDIINYRFIEEMLNFEKSTAVLRNISQRISDLCARNRIYGSIYYLKEGRFRIVLDNNDFDRTWEYANMACEMFNGEISENDMEINLETAVRIVQCPEDFDSLEAMIGFSSTAEHLQTVGEISLTKDLIAEEKYTIHDNMDQIIEQGILNNNFIVMYQPIFDVANRCFNRAEAVMYLFDDIRGALSPEVIRPVAEQSGAINDLGVITIDSVCAFIAGEGFKDLGIEQISINLSAVQCLQSNLADTVIGITEKYGVDPKLIMFEVTESIASDSQKSFDETIKRLSEYGFLFALDKYGTGYSNIINLSEMPISAVKFDKEFVNTSGNKRFEVILEKTLEMIKALDRTIIIDGVDTRETAEKFIEYRCNFLQGGYYAGVMEADELVLFLQSVGSIA